MLDKIFNTASKVASAIRGVPRAVAQNAPAPVGRMMHVLRTSGAGDMAQKITQLAKARVIKPIGPALEKGPQMSRSGTFIQPLKQ